MNILSNRISILTFFSCLMLFGWFIEADSETIVSGDITSDTVWMLDNSPYIIKANVIVENGVSLTIEPGVTVKFDGLYSLDVRGGLIAEGTESEKILFTSNINPPSRNDWRQLRFGDISDDDGCIVSHCVIEYSERGIYCHSASPTITYNTIRNNCAPGSDYGGIFLNRSSDADIYYNTITNNGNGIYLKGRYNNNYDPEPVIRYNNIHDNDVYNIMTEEFQHPDGTIIKAQYNYWGSSDPSVIRNAIFDKEDDQSLPEVRIDPFFTAAVGDVRFPIVLLEDVIDRFCPVDGCVTFNAVCGSPVYWRVVIKEAGGYAVRTYIIYDADSIFIQWYGYRDNMVTLVDDGVYEYYIYAWDLRSGTISESLTGTFEVKTDFPIARIVEPAENDVYTGGSVAIRGTAYASDNFDHYEIEYARNAHSDNWQMINSSSLPVTNDSLAEWEIPDENVAGYTIRARVFDTEESIAVDYINIKFLNIYNAGHDPGRFSPNGDGFRDECRISADITIPAEWLVTIKDLDNNPVRIFDGYSNNISVMWDGRDEGGNIVEDGTYKISLRAVEPVSGVAVNSYTPLVEVDGTFPFVEITYPSDGEHVTEEVRVRCTATDENHWYTTMYIGSGINPAKWNKVRGSTLPIINGEFVRIPIKSFNNGICTLWLKCEDDARNVSNCYRQFVVDNIQITNVSADPRFFNPCDGEVSNVSYTLDRPANVTIELFYLSLNPLPDVWRLETIIRTYVETIDDNVPKPQGVNGFMFDGRDSNGNVLPFGVYMYNIEAMDDNGAKGYYEHTNYYPPGIVNLENVSITPRFDPRRNDSCVITYDLVKPAWVDMRLFDGSTLIKHLVTFEPRPETGNIEFWNGRNEQGRITGRIDYTVRAYAQMLPKNTLVTWNKRLGTGYLFAEAFVILPLYNEVSVIKYSLLKEARVEMRIYDPNGNYFRTIFEDAGLRPAGEYLTEWDGRADDGRYVDLEGDYRVELKIHDAERGTYVRNANIAVVR